MIICAQEASLAWQKRKARVQSRGKYTQGGWSYTSAVGATNSKAGASSPRQRMQYSNMLAAAEAARRCAPITCMSCASEHLPSLLHGRMVLLHSRLVCQMPYMHASVQLVGMHNCKMPF